MVMIIKTKTKLAQFYGISRTGIYNWISRGLPTRRDGSFDTHKIDPFLTRIGSPKAPTSAPESNGQKTDFRKKLALERCRLLEIRRRELESSLCDKSYVVRVIKKHISQAKSIQRRIPPAIGALIPDLELRQLAVSEVERILDDSLRALSEALPSLNKT